MHVVILYICEESIFRHSTKMSAPRCPRCQHNPDTLQRLAIQQSSEFGRWYEEDYFPSHEEISHAKSLGMPMSKSELQCSTELKYSLFLEKKEILPKRIINGELERLAERIGAKWVPGYYPGFAEITTAVSLAHNGLLC